MEFPFISILTPTYKRRQFTPLMIYNVKNYDYPKEKLEWIIFDDSPEQYKQFKNEEELKKAEQECGVKINYIYDNSTHLSIGVKRNKLTKLAKYKICINQDTDDIYTPEYIKYSLKMLRSQKNAGLAGSPQMLFLFPNQDWKMTAINCPSMRQAHEATFCYTKKYWKQMGGYCKTGNGEGSSLIDFNEKNCVKTDCMYQMVCIAHKANTVDKEQFSDDKKESIYNLGTKPVQEIQDIVSKCLTDEFIIV